MKKKKNYPFSHLGVLLLLLVLPATVLSQQNWFQFDILQHYKQESTYEYLYKIPVDSIYLIAYKNAAIDVNTSWLSKPAYVTGRNKSDSLLRTNILPGYYLVVQAQNNTVSYRIRYKQTFHVSITDLRDVMLATVKDENGMPVSATVSIAGKEVSFDPYFRAYKMEYKNGDILKIRIGDEVQYFSCSKQRNSRQRTHEAYNYNRYDNNDTQPKDYAGYFVTNKPVYLPGDTVKYKAYILNPTVRTAVEDELALSLEDGQYYNPPTFAIRDAIKPSAPGVYFGEFVLGDSIKPDKYYQLKLANKTGSLRIFQKIKVEDYLLDENYLRVTGEMHRIIQPHDSVLLFAHAYNSNGLPVMDGQVSITVLPQSNGIYGDTPVFIPDTLYTATVPLDASGETAIGFPTSNFPDADMTLQCLVRLTNSNFERKDTSFQLTFRQQRYYIRTSEQGNRITAELVRNKKAVTGKGFLALNNGVRSPILFPYSDTLMQHYTSLRFSTEDSNGKETEVAQHTIGGDNITGQDDFKSDTAYLNLYNPRHILMRYSVYAGNNIRVVG